MSIVVDFEWDASRVHVNVSPSVSREASDRSFLEDECSTESYSGSSGGAGRRKVVSAPFLTSLTSSTSSSQSSLDLISSDVNKSRYCGGHLPSLPFMLVFLISFTVIVSSLSTFACMKSLTLTGINTLSSQQQEDLARNIVQRTLQFNILPATVVQTFEEIVRLGELRQPGFAKSLAYLPHFWPYAQQYRSGYVGFLDGTAYGFRVDPKTLSMTCLYGEGGSLYTYSCDAQGQKKTLIQVMPYNSTLRPWFIAAMAVKRYVVTPLQALVGVGSVGYIAAMPVFKDLMPPEFDPNLKPPLLPADPNNTFVRPGSSINRTVLAVVGADVELSVISSMLKSLTFANEPDRFMAWYFASDGVLVASSDPKATLVSPTGAPVLTSSVNNSLFNATMQFLLDNAEGGPANPDDGDGYSRAPILCNHQVWLDGKLRIVTTMNMSLASGSRLDWTLVMVQAYSDVYGYSDYANMVSLIVVFVVILPTMIALVAVFAIVFLSRPTRKLSSNMRQVTRDFDFTKHSIGPRSFIREINMMQHSYEAMRSTLKSFAKFAPLPIVKDLLQSKMEASIGVTEAEVSCLFSDIEGFTGLAETIDPRILMCVLEEYFDAMTMIVESTHGTVGDFIGDAVFAFWNVPHAVGRAHSALALECSIMMQSRMNELRSSWKSRNLPLLRIRIGVHSGRALAGNVGSRSRLKYSIIGDCVNVCARLEGLCKRYNVSVVTSADSWLQSTTHHHLIGRALGWVAVAGRRSAILVVAIEGEKGRVSNEREAVASLSWEAVERWRAKDTLGCLRVAHQMQQYLGAETHDEALSSMIHNCMNENDTGELVMTEK